MEQYLFILVLLVFVSRSLGLLGTKLKVQPIVGEVAGGLIVGLILIMFFDFNLPSEPLTILAQFGILILMFLAGLQTDFSSFSKHKVSALVVGSAGVVVSFVLVFLPLYFLFDLGLGASLFISAILSNTAIEICAGILHNIKDDKFRSVIMGAAFVDDVLAVFVLGVVSALVFTGSSAASIENLDSNIDGPGLSGWGVRSFDMNTSSMDVMSSTDTSSLFYPIPDEYDLDRPIILLDQDNASMVWMERTLTVEDDDLELREVTLSFEILVWTGEPLVLDHLDYHLSDNPLSTCTITTNSIPVQTQDLGEGWALITVKNAELEGVEEDDTHHLAIRLPVEGNFRTQVLVYDLELKEGYANTEDAGISEFSPTDIVILSIKVLLFLVISLTLVIRVVDWGFDKIKMPSEKLLLTASLLLAFAMAIIARWVGLHEVIGVYIAGLIVGKWGGKVGPMLTRRIQFQKVVEDIDPPIKALFGPLFFGFVGISLANAVSGGLTSDNGIVWFIMLTAMIVVTGFGGKIIGCGLGAKLTGFTFGRSFRIGCTMCGRGALELVMLTYGLSAGIISDDIFTAMVIFTIISILTTPLLFTFTVRVDTGTD